MLAVTLSLLSILYIATGHAPRLFNEHTKMLPWMHAGLTALCVSFLVLLGLSQVDRRFALAGRLVLSCIAVVCVAEPLLTWYDQHFISNAHSSHVGAAYSLFTHGGTFYLELPTPQSGFGFRTTRVEPKVAQGRRVLLLGDSFVVGTTSNVINSYAGVLESQLRAQFPSENITVFSAGVNGYGLEEQRYLFDYIVDEGYHFDAVVFHFFLGGDQVNNISGTRRIIVDGLPSRIHTNLFLRLFYPANLRSFHFLVGERVTRQTSEWHHGAVLPTDASNCRPSPGFQAYMAEKSRFSYAPGAQARVDMPYVLTLLDDLAADIRSKHLSMALVLLPDQNMELDAQRQQARGVLMDYDWIRRDLTAHVGSRYPVLDLTDAYRNRPDLFQCNGIHWSTAGNVYAGRVVAPFVASNLIQK